MGMPMGIFETFYNTIPPKCDTVFEGPFIVKNAEKYAKSLSKIVKITIPNIYNFTSNPSATDRNKLSALCAMTDVYRLQSLLSVSPYVCLSADLQSLFMHVNLYTLHMHA